MDAKGDVGGNGGTEDVVVWYIYKRTITLARGEGVEKVKSRSS